MCDTILCDCHWLSADTSIARLRLCGASACMQWFSSHSDGNVLGNEMQTQAQFITVLFCCHVMQRNFRLPYLDWWLLSTTYLQQYARKIGHEQSFSAEQRVYKQRHISPNVYKANNSQQRKFFHWNCCFIVHHICCTTPNPVIQFSLSQIKYKFA